VAKGVNHPLENISHFSDQRKGATKCFSSRNPSQITYRASSIPFIVKRAEQYMPMPRRNTLSLESMSLQ